MPGAFLEWADALIAFGVVPAQRAILATANLLLGLWETNECQARVASEHWGSPRIAVERASAFVVGQKQDPLDREILDQAGAALEAARIEWGQEEAPEWFAAAAALYSVDGTIGGGADHDLLWCALSFAEGALGFESVRNEVQAELVPWALGYSDPVRERVDARQREAAGECRLRELGGAKNAPETSL
ncbi:MAG: hypothetical protein JKY65_13295 [Planctomycetes bacterium]|nr:hypothetical protein [Planctomycetota bacterium]